MKRSRSTGLLAAVAFLVAISLLMMACGPGPDGPQGPTPQEDPPSGAVASTDDVEKATVYIRAAGGVYDQGREFGDFSVGQGSGLILDPSGLALTNNHVVAGAGFLEVYVSGEDEPRGAKILGRSECSDLALIDIDEGGYPYLEWREGEIRNNLDVRAAGYPATDEMPEEGPPDYTITRGIINSTEASGETEWASVESVIEHDALIRGGNSGGPLVDEEGKAVGVNYATGSDPETGATSGQSFAVSRDEAQDLLEQMKGGDVDSIGINGVAYGDPEAEFSGIAVISTVTGSPAAKAGVRGFVVDDADPEIPRELDIITKLEGTTLGEESTMEEFCNVLRGRGSPDQPLSIEVLRAAFDETGEPTSIVRYEGVLNGGPEGELKPVETILDETGDTGSGDTAGSDYTQITDDTGAITAEVPSSWTDVASGTFTTSNGDEVGPAMGASTDRERWVDTFEVPGMYLAASAELAERYPDDVEDRVLDDNDQSGRCEYEGRQDDYSDGKYTGKYDIYTNCDGTGNEYHVLAAVPEDRSFVVLLQSTVTSDGDREAEQRILDTFDVDPDKL